MSKNRVFLILLCLLALGLIVFAVMDYHSRTKQFHQRTSCVANQVMINLSKISLAHENGWTNGYVIPANVIWQDMGKVPQCRRGGTYSINPVGTYPSCSYTGTFRWEPFRWPKIFSSEERARPRDDGGERERWVWSHKYFTEERDPMFVPAE